MHKGQIFSTDFLFAMILIIFGFGLLLGSFEINSYNTKESALRNSMKEKIEAAAIVLANSSDFDCNIKGVELAYSINSDKLTTESLPANQRKLKEKLGLQDYNINIYTNSPLTTYVNDTLPTQNVIAIDLNVLVCTNAITHADLNKCITTNLSNCASSTIQQKKLTIKVAR